MKKLYITIIGMGLIGGSLALAFKRSLGENIFITGIDNDSQTLANAKDSGAVDVATADFAQGVKQADIVFLSTPVLQMVPIIKQILPFLSAKTIITDTGSTKQYIWHQLQSILPHDIYYIAGHPMAGKEHSGFLAADADLFRHKCYVIVEDTGAPAAAITKLCDLLVLTGASITTMDIAKHDRCASLISHIPHVTAAALVTLLNNSSRDIEANLKLAGGGFKDTTRIASSNADMWADVLLSNPEAIVQHLEELKGILDNVIKDINAGDRTKIYDYFSLAKQRRDNILDRTQKLFEI